LQHPRALHQRLSQNVTVSPDTLLRAGGGKTEGLEGMISRPLRGAQWQWPNARQQGLFQPEKSYIAAVRWPQPFCNYLSPGGRAVCPEDEVHIFSCNAPFGLGFRRDDMSAGNNQAFGYYESGPCRPFVGAEDSNDAACQIGIHFP
jgi:hypothetical protein